MSDHDLEEWISRVQQLQSGADVDSGSRQLNSLLRDWILRNGASQVAASEEAVESFTQAGVTCFSEPRVRPMVEGALREKQVSIIDENRPAYLELLRGELAVAAASRVAFQGACRAKGHVEGSYGPDDSSLLDRIALFQKGMARRKGHLDRIIQTFFQGSSSVTPLPLDVHAALLQFVEAERGEIDRCNSVVKGVQRRVWDYKMALTVAPPTRGKQLWDEFAALGVVFDVGHSDHSSDDNAEDDEEYSRRVVARRSRVVLSRAEDEVLKHNDLSVVGLMAVLQVLASLEVSKKVASAARERLLAGSSNRSTMKHTATAPATRTVESIVFSWVPEVFVELSSARDAAAYPSPTDLSLLPSDAIIGECNLRTELLISAVAVVLRSSGGEGEVDPRLVDAVRPILVPLTGVVRVLYGCVAQSRGEVPPDGSSFLSQDDSALSSPTVDEGILRAGLEKAFPRAMVDFSMTCFGWALGVEEGSLPPPNERSFLHRVAALVAVLQLTFQRAQNEWSFPTVKTFVETSLDDRSVSEEVATLVRRKQLKRAAHVDEMRRLVEQRALNSFIPVVASTGANPFHSFHHHWVPDGQHVFERAASNSRRCDSLHKLLASLVNEKSLPIRFARSVEECRRATPLCPPTLITNPLHPPIPVPTSDLLEEVLQHATPKFNLARYSPAVQRSLKELRAVLFAPIVPLVDAPNSPDPDPNLVSAGPLLCSVLFWYVFNAFYNPVLLPMYAFYYFDVIGLCMSAMNGALVSMKLESVFSFATKHEVGSSGEGAMSHHKEGEASPMDFLPHVVAHTVQLCFLRLFPNNAELFTEDAFVEPTSRLLFRFFAPQRSLSSDYFRRVRLGMFAHPSITVDHAPVQTPAPPTPAPSPPQETFDASAEASPVVASSAWPSPAQYNAYVKTRGGGDLTMDEDINIFNAIAIADPLTAQAMAKARRVAEEGDMADARYPQTSHGAELALVIECSRGGKGNTAGDVRRVRKLRALQGEVQRLLLPGPQSPEDSQVAIRARVLFQSMCAQAASSLLGGGGDGSTQRFSISSAISLGSSTTSVEATPPMSVKRLSAVFNSQRRRSTAAFDGAGEQDTQGGGEDLSIQIGRLTFHRPPCMHPVAFACAGGFADPKWSDPQHVASQTRLLAEELGAAVIELGASVGGVLGGHLFGSPSKAAHTPGGEIPAHHRPYHSPSIYDVPMLTTPSKSRAGISSRQRLVPSSPLCHNPDDPDEMRNFRSPTPHKEGSPSLNSPDYTFRSPLEISSVRSLRPSQRPILPPVRQQPVIPSVGTIPRNTVLLTVGDQLNLTSCSPSIQRGHTLRLQSSHPVRKTLTTEVEGTSQTEGSELARMIREQAKASATVSDAMFAQQRDQQLQLQRANYMRGAAPIHGPLAGLRRSEFVDDWIAREPPKVGTVDVSAELRGRQAPIAGLKEGTIWEGTRLAVAAKRNATELNDAIKRAERALQRRRGKHV